MAISVLPHEPGLQCHETGSSALYGLLQIPGRDSLSAENETWQLLDPFEGNVAAL